MSQSDDTLFPEPEESGEYGRHSTGILPSHVLKRLIRARREITAHEDIEEAQVQPASIDLRLGAVTAEQMDTVSSAIALCVGAP